MNNEPIYEYRKGEGWVISFGPRLLSVEDCQGKWYKHPEVDRYDTYLYPEICLGWGIINSTHKLQSGDVVPWPGGNRIYLITEILESTESRTKYKFKEFFRGGRGFNREDDSWVGSGGFRGIARPR